MGLKVFSVTLAELSGDSYLRTDVKCHSFFVSSNWNLFNSLDKRLIPLKDILINDYTLFDYQEDEKYKGIPTGQIYLDEDGEIKDFLPISIEEHPERLKYKVSNENILLSSLRLAKSPALFFENEDLSEYVFSNGFYIFKVNDGWNKKFVYYILRTKKLKSILDNHIYRGIGISAYKKEDLLKIKIPLIPKPKQDEIVTRIEPVEKKIKELKATIKEPQEIINKVFAREFGFDLEKFEESKKQKFFEVEFSIISKNNDLKLNVSSSLNNKIDFKIPNVRYFKIKNVAKNIFAGGDMPNDFSDEKNKEYQYPIYSNGKENLGLIGYCKKARVKEKATTISARGTIGFAVARNEGYFPIVRLISVIPNEELILNEYLANVINFQNIEKSGNTIAQLTTPMVENIEIPIPDINKQQCIIDEIKAELDKQEKIKKEIEEQRNKIDEIIEESINQ